MTTTGPRRPTNGQAGFTATPSEDVRRLEGPLLRPDQAAQLLSVKTSWVYEAARTGRMPCLRIGRHIRFTHTMIEEWLEGQR